MSGGSKNGKKTSGNTTTIKRRGIQPGDKVVNRHKKKAAGVKRVTTDILTAAKLDRAHSALASLPKRIVPAIKQPVDVETIIFDKAYEVIVRVSNDRKWNDEQRTAAWLYLTYLVRGTGSVTGSFRDLSDKERIAIKPIIEERFACTCWMKRKILKDTQLPGMRQTQYRANYTSAMQRFPATPSST